MRKLFLLFAILLSCTYSYAQLSTQEASGFIIKGKQKREVTFTIPTNKAEIDEHKTQNGIDYKESSRKAKIKPKMADSLIIQWKGEKVIFVSKVYKQGNTIRKTSFLIPYVTGKINYYHVAMELYNKNRNDDRMKYGKSVRDGDDYVYHSFVEKDDKIRYIPDLYKKAYMKKFVSDCDFIMNEFNDGKWNKAPIQDIVKAYNENCSK